MLTIVPRISQKETNWIQKGFEGMHILSFINPLKYNVTTNFSNKTKFGMGQGMSSP